MTDGKRRPLPAPIEEMRRKARTDSAETSPHRVRKVAEATPDLSSLKREFGDNLKVTSVEEGGKFTAVLSDATPDKSVAKRYLEMTQPLRDLEYEDGRNRMDTPQVHEMAAQRREEKMRRKGVPTGLMRCKPTYRKRWAPDGTSVVVVGGGS